MLSIILKLAFALTITFVSALASFAQSPNDQKARAYYFEAERAVGMEEFDDALSAITNAESLLGQPNASTTAMKVKIFYGQNNYTKAKSTLDEFYSYDSGENLARDMASYLTKIDNSIAEENARIAAENQARADKIEADRLAFIKAGEDKKAKVLADDRAAHRNLETRCRKDDLGSCFDLGYRYHLGKSPTTRINYNKAASYYAMSCNPSQYTLGCNNLGNLYRYKNISTDMRFVGGVYDRGLADVKSKGGQHEAFVLYKIACDNGQEEYGCWNLAGLYEKGVKNSGELVVRPNSKLARMAYKKSCKAGKDVACDKERNLLPDPIERLDTLNSECEDGSGLKCEQAALMYTTGIYVKKDLDNAVKLFALACDKNIYSSCHQLGRLSLLEDGGVKDISRASQALGKACSASILTACTELEALKAASNTYVEKDLKACEAGKAYNCENLGDSFDSGYRVPEDNALAAKYFLQACNMGRARSCNIYGVMRNTGEGVSKSQAIAVDYFRNACTEEYYMGCRNLADMYRWGNGVVQDKDKAIELYRKACREKVDEGCDRLINLFKKTSRQPGVVSLSLLTHVCEDESDYSNACKFIRDDVSAAAKQALTEQRASALSRIVKDLNKMGSVKITGEEDGEKIKVTSKVTASQTGDHCELSIKGLLNEGIRGDEPYEDSLDLTYEWGDEPGWEFDVVNVVAENPNISSISTRTPYCMSGVICSKSKEKMEALRSTIMTYRREFCSPY